MSMVHSRRWSIESCFQIEIQGSGCMTCAGVRLSQIPWLSLAGKGMKLLLYSYCYQYGIITAVVLPFAISDPGTNLFIFGALMMRRGMVQWV